RPSGSQVGTSFMEWTAMSISPASNASSISLVNRPLPPISLNGRSCTLSPVVLMTQISMAPGAASCGWAAIRRARVSSAWARASGEPRVPMRKEAWLPSERDVAIRDCIKAGPPECNRAPYDLFAMIVLGIESSCDETAAALVTEDRRILADLVAAQLADHRPYGGVVPEVAARAHLDRLDKLVGQAMREAGIGFAEL